MLCESEIKSSKSDYNNYYKNFVYFFARQVDNWPAVWDSLTQLNGRASLVHNSLFHGNSATSLFLR